MLETHPYGSFVPNNAKFLILGSFPGKAQEGNDWFYGSPRNQFWQILEVVYGTKLNTKKSKQNLLTQLDIAMADIIYKCERRMGSNLDTNLTNITYNIDGIQKILAAKRIEKIFSTSRFVEKKFRSLFKAVKIELVTLPSPSPRYAQLNKQEKINIYKILLPKLNSSATIKI
jgi:TDG/mug DNA glycosylase family protein